MINQSERRAETLNFIQSMLMQLNQMALGERHDMLAYLIEMAYLECGDLVRSEHSASAVAEYQRDKAA